MKNEPIIGMSTQVPFNKSMMKQQMKKLRFLTNLFCLFFIVILFQQKAIAQTLGINTTGALPDSSAMLDIISPNKGLLIPRVSLTSTTDIITITNPATSLLVYNTNASMTGGSGLGYYYFNGSLWVNFVSGSSSSNYVQNQVAADQAAGLRMTGNGLFNGGQVAVGTAIPSSGYLLTMNTSSGIGKGLNLTLSGGSGAGINVSSSNSAYDGMLITNSSSSVSSSFYGFGSVLSNTNIVSGYSGYRTSSGLSYGIYGINGTSALYATNASTWAAFLRGRTVISSETSPTSGLGTDLEIRNTTTGAGYPATVSMRQGTSNTTSATILANLNFGDNHQAGPQAQIQITRGAAGGASDLPTDMVFSTTPDASTTLTERMRILNNGTVGIGTMSPSAKLHTLSTTEQLRLGYDASNYYSTIVGSTGGVIFDAVGVGSAFTFSDAVNLPTASVGVTQALNDSTTKIATTAFVDRALSGVSGGSGWGLTGTSGTTGANFLGTTDNKSLRFRTNNTQKMIIDSLGNVGIGTTTATRRLDVVGGNVQFGVTYGVSESNLNVVGTGSFARAISVASSSGSASDFWGALNVQQSLTTLNSTTEQLRVRYDASNYYSTTVGSTGGVTFDAIGAGSAFTFSDAVNLPSASVGVTPALNDSTTKIATTAFVDRALSGVSGGSGWGLTGTSGTVDGTNFIGTTDNIPFSIKVNNQKAGRIDQTLKNAFWGYQTGNANSTGHDNIAIGHQALYSNTTGYENTANGVYALYSNTGGVSNTATGFKALYTNSTGLNNTANGWWALLNNTGDANTAVGVATLYFNTTGYYNSASGYEALFWNTTGYKNTASGYFGLFSTSTGYHNTGHGYGAGYTNTTGFNNTFLGHNADVSSAALNNATAIGANASVNATNKVRIGDANVTVIEGQVAFTSVSDGRFKKNINETDVKGLQFIMRLRPVAYNIDTRQFEEFLVKNKPDSIKVKHFKDRDFTASTAIRHNGFIAQEVEQAAQAINYNFTGIHKPESADDNYGLAYSEFVVPLVKAMQEQQKIIDDLKLEIDKLKAEVSKIPK